ncbi:hypothetical protein Leryth_022784 [Lithospermum erythrorhizon]|nr:hypothetical protein Leryth_022784 [Lithospermum erythrorhizon]
MHHRGRKERKAFHQLSQTLTFLGRDREKRSLTIGRVIEIENHPKANLLSWCSCRLTRHPLRKPRAEWNLHCLLCLSTSSEVEHLPLLATSAYSSRWGYWTKTKDGSLIVACRNDSTVRISHALKPIEGSSPTTR